MKTERRLREQANLWLLLDGRLPNEKFLPCMFISAALSATLSADEQKDDLNSGTALATTVLRLCE